MMTIDNVWYSAGSVPGAANICCCAVFSSAG